MPHFRKSSGTRNEIYRGRHRFEHWYRDNSVYFITSSCREKFPAFRSESAKEVFWDRFHHYANTYRFVPWVVSLMDTHYHVLGFLEDGEALGEMMRRLHGSTAKLVNDLLEERRVPFWMERGGRDYFDGCIRDEKQLRRAYRYTLTQSVRHGIRRDWHGYAHTRVNASVDDAVRVAYERGAYLYGVEYARYRRGRCQRDT